jgi:hypothetical protein
MMDHVKNQTAFSLNTLLAISKYNRQTTNFIRCHTLTLQTTYIPVVEIILNSVIK